MDQEPGRHWLRYNPHPNLEGRKTLASCMTLSKLVTLSDLGLSNLQNGDNNSSYLLRLLYRFKKIYCASHNVRHLAS